MLLPGEDSKTLVMFNSLLYDAGAIAYSQLKGKERVHKRRAEHILPKQPEVSCCSICNGTSEGYCKMGSCCTMETLWAP